MSRADGSERTVEVRYDFVVHAGRRVAMLSAIRDVTDRREVERLAQSRAQILDVVRQPVIVVDMDGTVSYANRSAETLLGHAGDVGQLEAALEAVIEGEHDRLQARSALARVRDGERESAELCVTGPEGEVEVLVVSGWASVGGRSSEVTPLEPPRRVP